MGMSGGSMVAQSACAMSQRGWKRQPEGGETRSGGMPAIDSRCARRSSKSGTERSSARVYGCRGAPNTSSTVPVSTMRAAYMTATRSHVCATTARSCVTST